MIGHVAVVPSTPLVLDGLPGARHPGIVRLAAATTRALAGLADLDAVVLLAGGPLLGVRTPVPTDLCGYGLDLPAHVLAPAPDDLRDAVARVVDAAQGDGGTPDLAVLGRLIPTGTPALGVTVPPTPGAAAERLAFAILDAAGDRRIGVVVAGDLGAGHGPKPPRPDALPASEAIGDRVVAALDGGRPADLTRLDPDLVRASGARAAGALAVLGHLLDRARLGTVVRAVDAPLGVRLVVAQGG